jgi:hypothetical protein
VRKKLFLVLAPPVVLSTLASAQHAVPPAPRPPVHVSPAPIYHAPLVPMPVARPPIVPAPISTPLAGRGISFPRGVGPTVVRVPVGPIRPIRPRPPVILVYSPLFIFDEPFSLWNGCWWASCDLFWPWTLGYTMISSPGPMNYVSQASEAPFNVYGGERDDFPELFLKDGTILNVTDYWVVDGQLHFKMIEAIGQKPVERSVPFEELDLQKTVDANTARGFRFILRNEPYEQYVRDHPEGPPTP